LDITKIFHDLEVLEIKIFNKLFRNKNTAD